MTIIRHYVMHAKEGQAAALETALRALASVVRGCPGSAGVELLRDSGNERRFVFIERWDSLEAHKGARDMLTPDVMGPVSGALDGPPDGAYFDPLLAV